MIKSIQKACLKGFTFLKKGITRSKKRNHSSVGEEPTTNAYACKKAPHAKKQAALLHMGGPNKHPQKTATKSCFLDLDR